MKIRKMIKQFIPPLVFNLIKKGTPAEREYERLLSLYDNVPRYTKTNISFNKLNLTIPDFASVICQIKSILLEKIYFFDSMENNKVIIDCGANIGLSVIYFKTLYPEAQVIAFEADPKIFSYLEQNMANNKIDAEIINKAIWTDNNGVSFLQDGADAGRIENTTTSAKIPSIRLRDILTQYKKITMLKIDIEGAEYEILKDCKNSLTHVDNLFLEYHSFYKEDQRLDEILKIIKENGFRYYMNTINRRVTPFIKKETGDEMDLQIEIFCYK